MYNSFVKVYNFLKKYRFFAMTIFLTCYDSEFDNSFLQILSIFVKFIWQRFFVYTTELALRFFNQ